MASKKVKLTLLENGLDFILHSLEHLEHDNNDPRNIKYGVLHLSSGIELVLKQRLIQEHPSLIYWDLGKFDKKDFIRPDKNTNTIDLPKLLIRLKHFGELEFDDSPFSELKILRNQFEHGSFNEDLLICKSKVSQAIHGILTFIDTFFDKRLSNDVKSLLDNIREKLKDFDSFHESRMSEIKPLLERESSLFYCPVCKQNTYSISKHKCFYCNTKYKNSSIAVLNYLIKCMDYDPAWGSPNPDLLYGNCPICNSKQIIRVNDFFKNKKHGLGYLCFDCGYKIGMVEANKCEICGRLISNKETHLCKDFAKGSAIDLFVESNKVEFARISEMLNYSFKEYYSQLISLGFSKNKNLHFNSNESTFDDEDINLIDNDLSYG